jgi:uncharacterized membrane protein
VKKHLLTGFMILLPMALTIWIFSYLLNIFTDPLYKIIEKCILLYEKKYELNLVHHEFLISFLSRFIDFFVTLFLVISVGFVGRRFFFNSLIQFTHKLMLRIPVVKTIYRLTKDITKAMFSTDQKTFKETVLIPFPSAETHGLGFVTGEAPEVLKKAIKDLEVVVFIPTAPHPISGYMLFTSRKMLHTMDISTEETFKFLISCGVGELTKDKEDV